MPSNTPVKAARKAATKVDRKVSQAGKTVRVLTTQERVDDMRAFGREQGSSKDAALAFLRRAGIVTSTGKLTKPFRSA